MSIFSTITARKEYLHKVEIGYGVGEGEIKWNFAQTSILIGISFFGGILAAVVGIGGATIYSPLLLEMNVNPRVSSATSMFLVLYTTLSTNIQFAIAREIHWPFALWFALWVVIGTLIGLTLVGRIVAKTGRASIIVFILSFVLFIAACATAADDGLKIRDDRRDGIDIFQTGNPCKYLP